MKGYIVSVAVLMVTILAGGLNTASAQTIGYAEAIDRLAKACGKDIRSHCKGVNLGGGRIINCLKQNGAKISSQCNQTYPVVLEQLQKRAAAQAAVAKICQADAAEYCQGVQPGEAHILNCLLKASRVVGASCNRAITDAGWR